MLLPVPTRFSLQSFAKINWTLRVLGKRDDGYHELFTVFQTVSLHDTITFEKADTLELTCTDPAIPIDERNLITLAAKALQNSAGTSAGARIRLEKRIPSPGGLGGGSSNAAMALIGLSRLWEGPVEDRLLNVIASALGSDVPFFLNGGTAVGTGRGEKIEPLADISVENILIVSPKIAVSTADVYASLNEPALTPEERNRILIVSRNEADHLDPLNSELKNDLEPVVFAAHPEIRRVKDSLLGLGARNAALCGSGASVFGVFDNKETREAAQKALETESTWRKFPVATVSRAKYREALEI